MATWKRLQQENTDGRQWSIGPEQRCACEATKWVEYYVQWDRPFWVGTTIVFIRVSAWAHVGQHFLSMFKTMLLMHSTLRQNVEYGVSIFISFIFFFFLILQAISNRYLFGGWHRRDGHHNGRVNWHQPIYSMRIERKEIHTGQFHYRLSGNMSETFGHDVIYPWNCSIISTRPSFEWISVGIFYT